mmetsp:Transcript_60311/g.197303  ORF Transcript_60311/g.197303 Transcript_60311/m.197303 type:complete len:205 (-) Transcript_60311:1665-2279(-)
MLNQELLAANPVWWWRLHRGLPGRRWRRLRRGLGAAVGPGAGADRRRLHRKLPGRRWRRFRRGLGTAVGPGTGAGRKRLRPEPGTELSWAAIRHRQHGTISRAGQWTRRRFSATCLVLARALFDALADLVVADRGIAGCRVPTRRPGRSRRTILRVCLCVGVRCPTDDLSLDWLGLVLGLGLCDRISILLLVGNLVESNYSNSR